MKIVQGYSQKIDDEFTLRVATAGRGNMEVLSRILELNITVHGEPNKEYIKLSLFLLFDPMQ